MQNTPNIVVGSRAIQCIVKGTKKIFSYQGADNTTTDAQYALVAAGRAGTDGILTGVQLTGGREITVTNVSPRFDNAGDASGPVYAGPFGNWGTPANTGPAAFDINLGTPIDDLPSNLLASTAITALPVTCAKSDVARALSVTGNALSTSVLNLAGIDLEGNAIGENLTLNGTTLVAGTRAFSPSQAVVVSLVTPHTGDTFTVGVTDILGLPVRLDNRGAIPKGGVVFGATVEATEPTVTWNATDLSLNTILLNTDLDGSHAVIVNGIQCDSPLPGLIPQKQ